MTSAPDAPTPLAPPTAAELCAFIEPLLSLARQAGAEIMAVYANPIAVELKADDSPLTAADLRSHRVISQGLRRLTPTIPVISEEATVAASAWGECYWLVDPLDGTKEFVAQNGEFTINIALVVAGEPVLGLIGIPVADTWVVGIPGVLAQQQIGVNPPSPIHTQAYTPTRALRVLASRSHGSAALTQFLARLPSHTRMSAGSALKFVRIASGVADVYPRLGPTHYWDSAAGQAIVVAAGGCVIDATGVALRYPSQDQPPNARCLNPDFIVLADAALLPQLTWGPTA